MRKLFLFFGFSLIAISSYCQVGIGTVTPSTAAMLEVSSTSDAGVTYKGMMPPRVPSFETRQAINPSSIDIGLLIFVESIGCLQIWNGVSWESIYCLDTIPIEPWINEFHYDNIGADTNEFIEIAGPAGLDLSNYRILLYNGADGKQYDAFTLSGIIDNELKSYGALSFPRKIQNGGNLASPEADGIALVKNGKVIQFLSYEGSFIAIDGLAIGLTSINIGVNETDSTPLNQSLQLKGPGNKYGDFIWNAPSTATPETINDGQIIN
jgi:hypothetical protein